MSEPFVTEEELGASASIDMESLANKRTKFCIQPRYVIFHHSLVNQDVSNISRSSKIDKNIGYVFCFRQLLTKWGTI